MTKTPEKPEKRKNHVEHNRVKKIIFWLLIGGGSIIVLIGVGLVVDSHTKGAGNIPSINSTENSFYPITITLEQSNNTNNLAPSIPITLSQNEIFAGDTIKYSSFIQSNRLNEIKEIFVFVDSEAKDYLKFQNPNDFNRLVSDKREEKQVVEIYPNSNPSHLSKGELNFPVEQDMYFGGVILKNDGGGQTIPSEKILHVYPSFAKYQFQTNHAIRQEINQTKQNLIAQNLSNETVEGLTWIIVGAIPIEFGLALRTEIRKSTSSDIH